MKLISAVIAAVTISSVSCLPLPMTDNHLVTRAVADVPNASYLGCYTDKKDRALGYSIDVSKSKNYITACQKAAIFYGATIFALQNGVECYYDVGTGYKTYGGSTQCNKSCQDSTSNTCGGGYANSVYQVTSAGTAKATGDFPGATYLGCFESSDNNGQIIQTQVTVPKSNSNYAFGCRDLAISRNADVFAIQYDGGRVCYLGWGTAYSRKGKSSRCIRVCTDSKSPTFRTECGGDSSNSIYRVNSSTLTTLTL